MIPKRERAEKLGVLLRSARFNSCEAPFQIEVNVVEHRPSRENSKGICGRRKRNGSPLELSDRHRIRPIFGMPVPR
jgi:hypothetical protein